MICVPHFQFHMGIGRDLLPLVGPRRLETCGHSLLTFPHHLYGPTQPLLPPDFSAHFPQTLACSSTFFRRICALNLRDIFQITFRLSIVVPTLAAQKRNHSRSVVIMVFPGRFSTGCLRCRQRKVKVSGVSRNHHYHHHHLAYRAMFRENALILSGLV